MIFKGNDERISEITLPRLSSTERNKLSILSKEDGLRKRFEIVLCRCDERSSGFCRTVGGMR